MPNTVEERFAKLRNLPPPSSAFTTSDSESGTITPKFPPPPSQTALAPNAPFGLPSSDVQTPYPDLQEYRSHENSAPEQSLGMDTSDLMRRLLEKKGNGELQQGKGSGLGGIAGAFASTAGTDWPSNFASTSSESPLKSNKIDPTSPLSLAFGNPSGAFASTRDMPADLLTPTHQSGSQIPHANYTGAKALDPILGKQLKRSGAMVPRGMAGGMGRLGGNVIDDDDFSDDENGDGMITPGRNVTRAVTPTHQPLSYNVGNGSLPNRTHGSTNTTPQGAGGSGTGPVGGKAVKEGEDVEMHDAGVEGAGDADRGEDGDMDQDLE